MLINYGFIPGNRNPSACLEISWDELQNAMVNIVDNDLAYIRKRYRTWDYGVEDHRNTREPNNDRFQIMHDRIPFRLDDLFNHIFELWYLLYFLDFLTRN